MAQIRPLSVLMIEMNIGVKFRLVAVNGKMETKRLIFEGPQIPVILNLVHFNVKPLTC